VLGNKERRVHLRMGERMVSKLKGNGECRTYMKGSFVMTNKHGCVRAKSSRRLPKIGKTKSHFTRRPRLKEHKFLFDAASNRCTFNIDLMPKFGH
jgi:hypothetical protein